MAFPSSPANGQRASVNNIIYEYNDTKGAWLRVSAQGFTSANLTVGGIITDNYYRADGTSLLGVNKSVYNGTASATTSVSLVDSVPTAGNTSVSWSLTSKDSNNSTYKNSVVSSLNDGTNVYYSEYGIILSNASVSVSTFTSNIVSGNLRLYAVGDSANVTITFQRTLLGSSTDVGYITAGSRGAQGPEGNVNVSYGNTEVATYLTTYTGNLSAGATTIGGNLTVSGNLIVNGNVTYINANNVNINDSLIYLADDNPADTLDIGFVSAFTDATRYQHTGLVRDATDGVWKLFANVVAEPNTTVDFTNANYSNLQIGNLIANNITATTNDLTLSAISIGNVNLSTLGGLQFKAIEATGSVNVWNVRGGDGSTTSPRFTTEGTGTNIAGQFNTKGTGALQFYSGNTEQMRITNTASAVNYVQVTGGATGNSPVISGQGSDSNVALSFTSKGTNAIRFLSNNAANLQFRIVGTNPAVNNLAVTGAIATNAPSLSSEGTDTNISMAFQPKGTGAIDLAAGSSGVNISNGGTVTAITRIAAGSGYATAPTVAISAPTTAGGVQATATCTVTAGAVNTTFTITNAGSGYIEQPTITFSGGGGSGASAFASVGALPIVRALHTEMQFHTAGGIGFEVQTYGAGTSTSRLATFASSSGNPTILEPRGTTNIDSVYSSRGTGVIRFTTNSFSLGTGAEQLRVSHTASAVNYVQVTGAATGSRPTISAQGTDTNIDLTLTSKGSGNITTANSVVISNSSASTSTTTGALVATGGVGIGGDLNVSGEINTSKTVTALNILNPFLLAGM